MKTANLATIVVFTLITISAVIFTLLIMPRMGELSNIARKPCIRQFAKDFNVYSDLETRAEVLDKYVTEMDIYNMYCMIVIIWKCAAVVALFIPVLQYYDDM